MEAGTSLSCLTPFFLLYILLIPSKVLVRGDNEEVKRSHFPDGFLFGVATSAYQIEGGIHEDGRGISNWDVFVRIKGNVENGDTGEIADDHYHRFLEDIEIIHSLGVDSCRFSISWTRILPRGRFGDVNPAGIMFYNKIIDNLLLKGIEPFVTIHHQDYPEELLEKYGGWLSPMMQEDFVYFAEVCFKNFGDRVKHWITLNEPNAVSQLAYMTGIYPPSRCSPPFGNCSAGNSDVEPLISMHNMLLAHSKAQKLYREHFQSAQGGIIGIVIHAYMYEPLTDDEHDKEAASRALAFYVAWTYDPLVFGDYPPEMCHYLKSDLPIFTSEEKELIKDSVDFLGINHYGTLYARDCIHKTCVCLDSLCTPGADHAIRGFVDSTPLRNGVLIGEPTGMLRFFVVPRGMERIIDYVKNRYNNKPIFILENGYSFPRPQVNLDDPQHDVKRVEYHKEYLAFLARAIRNGADVRGYFIWSLMDNFEWTRGYSVKFGLYSIETLTLNRVPRTSAKWYRDFLSDKKLEPRNAISSGKEEM
ncbi:hypothetical protein M9H77_21973 [Catharanthus roseus]|uniref:Uncharacterized protein n=1 Tax=Catharanthus roseus TaxID=4058 RepID=A0ACC0AP64_CATRO|nr:hypothetical protein M9H77_21973 [Catharanthus roseus]